MAFNHQPLISSGSMSRSLEADKVFWIKDIQLTDHLQLKA